ncbi:MAG: response regulator transcription factor [Bacteroidota bacterium]
MTQIKIAIVEDEIEFQEWILEEIATADDIASVGAFKTAEEALEKVPALEPDVVIMDLTLHNSAMDGIECILRLRQNLPEVEFLVISSNANEQYLFEAIKVGARAYLQKGEISRELVELIREFSAGGSPMTPGIARRILNFFGRPRKYQEQLGKLSPREREVLEQLSRGFLYKEIADNLSIAEGTVKQHLNKTYKKLEVNNSIEAILKLLGRDPG